MSWSELGAEETRAEREGAVVFQKQPPRPPQGLVGDRLLHALGVLGGVERPRPEATDKQARETQSPHGSHTPPPPKPCRGHCSPRTRSLGASWWVSASDLRSHPDSAGQREVRRSR